MKRNENGNMARDNAKMGASNHTRNSTLNSKKSSKQKEKQKKSSTSEPVYKYDIYGFVVEKNNNRYRNPRFNEGTPLITLKSKQSRRRRQRRQFQDHTNNPELESKREAKWIKMINEWNAVSTEKRDLIKRRVRKGIPHKVRGRAWSMIADVPSKVKGEKKGLYRYLLKIASKQGQESDDKKINLHEAITNGKSAKKKFALQHSSGVSPSGEVFRETIEKDIHRTYPTHKIFLRDEESDDEDGIEADLLRDKGGEASLRRVLRAYSVIDPDVGYCQGMNFISAMFITLVSNEEEAFWLLENVMDTKSPCSMRGLFGDGMAQAQEVLYIAEKVIQQYLPKIAAHFERENVHVTMFATQWLLTNYSSNFSFDLVTRVWDCFLIEGWKISYRVMLALLSIFERELLLMPFEEILGFLKQMPIVVDGRGELVMKEAFNIPLRTRFLEMCRTEYTKSRGA